MTISPPEANRPRTLVGFDIGSAGFGGVWYWMLPAIPIDPEEATVVCSFCCRVPLTPLMFPWTKIMLALRSPGPCQPLGTPVNVRVDGPGPAPGQLPPDGGGGHPLLDTVVWLFVRSTVTVVVVEAWTNW